MGMRTKLNAAGINIPKGTPKEKLELIDIGLQLMELDSTDVKKILDKDTSINQAEMILRDGRLSGKIKHLDYSKSTSKILDEDLEMEM